MNSTIKYLAIASAIMLGLAACEKTEAPAYEAAPVETGAQVFFPSAPAATVKLTKGEPSLTVMVARGDTTTVLDVPITASGDATTWFDVPAKVSFAAGEKSVKLVIAAKDVLTMAMNEFYPLTLSIDEELASEYGANSLSFNIGIELPWIVFDEAGTMIEGWWGEEEPGMPMKYQQISDNVRYCVVEGCWGHETGPTYPVQPYIWYWNTETNYCYVPGQFMGYTTSSGDVWVSDEGAFYNLYWNMQSPGKNGSGLEQGSDEWFAWHDARRAAWAPEGDPFPYYDGEGKFYLGDFFFLTVDGVPTGSGYQFGGTQDVYVCSFAVNYTVGVSYEGLLSDKNGNEFITGALTIEGGDVTDVYVLLVEGKDPNAAVTILEADDVNLEEVEGLVKLSEEGEFRIPMFDGAKGGVYTLVAVPLDKKGEFAWDYAVFESFQYGEISPLDLEYTSADFTAAATMAALTGKTWMGLGIQLGNSGWDTDRSSLGTITITDIDDGGTGDDLISISGLSAGAGAYFGFDDSIEADLYNGTIYTHKTTNGSFMYGSTPMYVLTQWYDSAGDEVYNVNYALIAAYVGEGLIAFVPYPSYANQYGIVFDGLLYEAFTDAGFTSDSDAGTLAGVRQILLVDTSVYSSPSAANAAIHKSLLAPKASRSITPLRKTAISINHDASLDVVASGRVWGYNANREVINFAE